MVHLISSLNKYNITFQQNDQTSTRQLIYKFCNTTKLPSREVNHCTFDEQLVQKILLHKQIAVQVIFDNLAKERNQNLNKKNIVANLYLLNRLIDENVQFDKQFGYSILSQYNDSDDPNIQTMLAGIYRKTLIPQAFLPLVSMLTKQENILSYNNFSPKAEICGALLEYMKVSNAQFAYEQI